MRILHELNQLDKGGAERVVLGIIKHDKQNRHIIYTYKDGPMRPLFEAAGAEIIIEDRKKENNLEIDLIHLHTGGDESHLARSVRGQLTTIETVHSPVVSAVRDEWIHQRIGVSNVVSKMNRKCITIYNGVDVDRLEKRYQIGPEDQSTDFSFRAQVGIPGDAFVVGRLGRLGLDKCVEEWLVACKKFQDSNLCSNPHFLIVGDEASNAKGYLAKLKIMAASLPLRNVHFVPAVEAVGWAFEAMDVFMYPSPTEGFGLAYMEAMACGIPTILWDNELTRELALGGAWLCQPTVKELFESLLYFWLNPSIRQQFGENGQKAVLADFTEAIMSKNYQDLYKKFEVKEPSLAGI